MFINAVCFMFLINSVSYRRTRRGHFRREMPAIVFVISGVDLNISLTVLFSFFLKVQTIPHHKFNNVSNCFKIYPKIDWKTLYSIDLIFIKIIFFIIDR